MTTIPDLHTPAPSPAWSSKARRGALMGDVMIWLCGGALSLNLLLVIGLVGLLGFHGLGYFWPQPLFEVKLKDGTVALGEIHDREAIPAASGKTGETSGTRIKFRFANQDLGARDFEWISEDKIASISSPPDAARIERLEWSHFFGYVRAVKRDGVVLEKSGSELYQELRDLVSLKSSEAGKIATFERTVIGDVNSRLRAFDMEAKRIIRTIPDENARKSSLEDIQIKQEKCNAEYAVLTEKLKQMRQDLDREVVVLQSAGGQSKELPVASVTRFILPNQLAWTDSLGVYFSRIGEFLFDNPRNLNTEGGIFPAIFGTVLMVFLMSFAVVPLGVLAALYLREYAKQGLLVRIVRIAVNNLAGVPSIVFGMFGLGFFVYTIGGSIDSIFFADALPTPTFGTGGILWASLTLALLTVPVVIVATEEGLAAVPRIVREGSLALGATKFETTWRVVVPAAAPGILTGLILAMARAAGEVAPLMIVGMVKLAPTLPIDLTFPFIHFERKFMHLGFHIYDVGFQNKNVDATKPIVFATAFLLILIITIMNLVAISLRNHLRKKYAGAAV